MENFGTGIRRIEDSYAGSKTQPIVKAGESFVKLILPNQNYTDKPIPSTDHNQENIGNRLGDVIIVSNEEGTIINYLTNKSTITRPQVEKLLDVKTSQARRYLKSLIQKQIIESIGSGPQTQYQLARKISIK